jgi:hypothetical protein
LIVLIRMNAITYRPRPSTSSLKRLSKESPNYLSNPAFIRASTTLSAILSANKAATRSIAKSATLSDKPFTVISYPPSLCSAKSIVVLIGTTCQVSIQQVPPQDVLILCRGSLVRLSPGARPRLCSPMFLFQFLKPQEIPQVRSYSLSIPDAVCGSSPIRLFPQLAIYPSKRHQLV